MATYEEVSVRVRQELLASVTLTKCQDCGSVVLDTDMHDDFHYYVNLTVERINVVEKLD